MWFASAKPPYGTLDAAEWAPSTASKADISVYHRDVRFTPESGHCAARSTHERGCAAKKQLWIFQQHRKAFIRKIILCVSTLGGEAMSALGILTILLPTVFAFFWLLWRASI